MLWTLLLLVVVSLVTFVLMHEVPGGPFDSIKKPPQQVIENLEAYYHLDRHLWQQYAEYVYNVAVPRLQTTEPTADERRRFLFQVSAGRLHPLWMDFGPWYQARGRMVSDIFRNRPSGGDSDSGSCGRQSPEAERRDHCACPGCMIQ